MEEGKITDSLGLGNLLDVTRIHTHTHTHMHAPPQSIEIYMHAQTQKQTERERMMKGCFFPTLNPESGILETGTRDNFTIGSINLITNFGPI